MMLRHKTIINKIHWHRQPTAITHSHTHTHTHTHTHSISHNTHNRKQSQSQPKYHAHYTSKNGNRTKLTTQRDRITCIHSKPTTAQVQKLTWLTAVKKIKSKQSHSNSDRRRWRTADMLQWFLPVWLDDNLNKPWKKQTHISILCIAFVIKNKSIVILLIIILLLISNFINMYY